MVGRGTWTPGVRATPSQVRNKKMTVRNESFLAMIGPLSIFWFLGPGSRVAGSVIDPMVGRWEV